MAIPVATVAPPCGFNDDDDLFRSESIGSFIDIEGVVMVSLETIKGASQQVLCVVILLF
ncbi:hypothetical protein HanOQP8_Chr17g0676551 [Helianthus annuus]|nr:hypothetical protein HanOQP8_Chr17g0676551 [Helianthus annuus]